MLASSAKFVKGVDWPCAQSEETLSDFSDGLMVNPFATIRRFLLLQTRGMAQPKKTRQLLDESVNKSLMATAYGLKGGLGILQDVDLRAELKTITCPFLMVLGGKDYLIPVESGRQSLRLNHKIELHVIDEAPHILFLSHKNELARYINKFMLIESMPQ